MAQAEALGVRFSGLGVAAVVSSPVQRAMETASVIAGMVGVGVTVEAGLEEIDFGGWTGMTFAALGGDPLWGAWNSMRGLVRCPGGETMLEVQARAVGALGRLREGYVGGEVVVVSHSDVIKAVLATVLGMSLERLDRLVVGAGTVSRVVVFEGDWRVEGVGV